MLQIVKLFVISFYCVGFIVVVFRALCAAYDTLFDENAEE